MGHIVTVDGIERYLSVHGHTLQCDECGDTYNGGNGGSKGGPIMPRGYREITPQRLIEDAIQLGWKGLEKYQDPDKVRGMAPPDLCPVCGAMKKAPYWPTIIHEPELEKPEAFLIYNREGPLLQQHTVVIPVERRDISILTRDWPQRDRFNEPPAVMSLKVIAADEGTIRLGFDSKVQWTNRKPGHWKGKLHAIRLWSWGDRVYAQEISSKH